MSRAPAGTHNFTSKVETQRAMRPYRWIKRGLDIVGSLLLMIPLLPLFLIIAMAITIECRGPIFFLQMRLGRGGKKFGLYKFRTLKRLPTSEDAQGSVMVLSGAGSDITRVGKFLRASGLNELPQLINILKGEMSFVGPRPAVLHHEQYYTDWHRRRLDLRPGVTGLAQVCGRNVIPWGWRVLMDRYYIEHCNFWLDLQILIKTSWVVLGGIGTEGDESVYFNFDKPDDAVLDELRQKGVFRTFLTYKK